MTKNKNFYEFITTKFTKNDLKKFAEEGIDLETYFSEDEIINMYNKYVDDFKYIIDNIDWKQTANWSVYDVISYIICSAINEIAEWMYDGGNL